MPKRNSNVSAFAVPRITGADIELGNFILGLQMPGGTGYEASRLLLSEVDGMYSETDAASYAVSPTCSGTWSAGWPAAGSYGGAAAPPVGYYSRDFGRKYLASNGGCIYIDLNHLEICIPEVAGARDHVAATHAMYRHARAALQRANARLPEGQSIQLLANNSDGRSHSYGSHLNFLVRRRTFDNLTERKLHYLLFLASYQVSSMIFAGQGKVGSENERSPVPYQISQRADFVESLKGVQTTHARPIVNLRDEALCGPRRAAGNPGRGPRPADRLARVHCIFYDSNLCHVAMLLKVGVMQIVLSMIEAESVDVDLLLDDPVAATHAWSEDPSLRTRARLAHGNRHVTAVQLQRMFFERAVGFAETGALDGVVADAREILELWGDTLDKLEHRDFDALARRLDWVLKLQTLENALAENRRLDWQSAELRYLDQIYASLDERAGLYWRYENLGIVDRVVEDADIARLVADPPEDTRAWTRAMLLRAAGEDRLDRVDWDEVGLRIRDGAHSEHVRVRLDDPRHHTRRESQQAFRDCDDLAQIAAALGGEPDRAAAPVSAYAARTWH